ncbi:MAG: MlaD family protein [Actinomycetota bacterium]
MISFRERRAWLVGLVSILSIAVGVGAAFSINRFPALRGVYSLSADLEDAAGLQPGNEVRVAGVKVGKVTSLRLTSRAARVTMEIENDIKLPEETRLEVKLKTLLGQKFIDLQLPAAYLEAASGGGDPSGATDRYLEPGDVIPRSQTTVPFEIYQAATEGSAVLEEIDKVALRKMIKVLSRTVGASKQELGRALESLDAATQVLASKGSDIASVLRNSEKVTRTLAAGDEDLENILGHSAEVLEVLADRRTEVSSLLRATNDLARNLALLLQVARGSIQVGAADLNGLLAAAESELGAIDDALAELDTAQQMFARPLQFGRFVEGHVCAVTSEDTCVPQGSPSDPGLPIHGVQPSPGTGGPR